MTVNITAKKIQVTQAFSDYATKKIEAKLAKSQSAQQDLYSVQSRKRQTKTMLLMPA